MSASGGILLAWLDRVKITSSLTAYDYLRKNLTADVEELWAVALRSDRSVIVTACLFRGTVDHCFAHPRDIFRFACQHNAAALILAHNHPSLDPRPSPEDRRFTKQLIRLSRMIEIPILDHIIVCANSYWSFTDKKLFRAVRK